VREPSPYLSQQPPDRGLEEEQEQREIAVAGIVSVITSASKISKPLTTPMLGEPQAGDHHKAEQERPELRPM
jgi:hypothetical protein